MRRLVAVTIAILATGAVAGAVLASGGRDASSALTVELDEWGLATSTGQLEPGTIELTQANTGRVEHELLIVRTNRPADELPRGLSGVKPSLAGRIVLGAEHSHHDGGEQPAGVDHLAPGETRRTSVRLRPGRYVLLCGIEGHYEAGQHGALTVG